MSASDFSNYACGYGDLEREQHAALAEAFLRPGSTPYAVGKTSWLAQQGPYITAAEVAVATWLTEQVTLPQPARTKLAYRPTSVGVRARLAQRLQARRAAQEASHVTV